MSSKSTYTSKYYSVWIEVVDGSNFKNKSSGWYKNGDTNVTGDVVMSSLFDNTNDANQKANKINEYFSPYLRAEVKEVEMKVTV